MVSFTYVSKDEKQRYKKVFERNYPLGHFDLQFESLIGFWKEFFKTHTSFAEVLRVILPKKGSAEIYFRVDKYLRLLKELKENLDKDKTYFDYIVDLTLKTIKEFRDMVNNPSPILEKLSSIKKESVLEAINDYLLKCSQVITISWSFDMFGDALIDRMVDLLNKEGKYSEETTKMILSKGILSIFIKEKKEFLSLMRNIKNKSKEEINEALQKHLKKWYFIGMGTVTEKPFSIEDFENKFDFFKDKDLDQEIKRIEELKNKEDKEISKFINDSNLSRRLLEAINQIRKYMSFKNNERVMLHDYTFKSFTIFNKIKKICSYEDHRFIFFKDVISFIKEEIDHQELLERAKRRENKRYELLVEDDQLKIKEIEKQKEVFVGGNLFKGLAVSKGFMRGPIKIVKDPSKEHQKLNNGDILVTSMTTPNFVPLMERAAAIITEEGGMLCHAAIVSRELGIPAVVGVRGIMSSLKDGDLVEIDAEKGIVKILK